MTSRRNQLLKKLVGTAIGEDEKKLYQLTIERICADMCDYYFKFYHNEGSVCPFGVLCGKLFIIITIILNIIIYYDYYNYNIKLLHFIILILCIFISLINIPLLIKLIPVFLLQFLIIYF